jgi:predicted transcriptional regulator
MTAPHRLPPLSDAQLEVMNVVWEQREVTVGDVWSALSQQRAIARNTVQTVMSRLSDKGWLKHRRQGRAFVYTATVGREATLRNLVDRLVETAFAGSAEGLVVAMLEGRGLSQDEAKRIRKLIADARGESP